MDTKDFPYEIRFAYKEEWQKVIALAWKTFLKFEALDYSKEGVESFNNFITDQTLYKMFVSGAYQLMVALDNSTIIGLISVRNINHVSLLFVEESFHKKGIGTNLVKELCSYLFREECITRITVNSSPFAVGFYHKLGFKDMDKELTADGIRYTPMEFFI